MKQEKLEYELEKVNQLENVNYSKLRSKLTSLFLSTNGIFKQHINSYNYFIETDIKMIVKANSSVDSDIDPNFYLKYLDIYVGKPIHQDGLVTQKITPGECRLRDLTYSAPIIVEIEYTRGKQLVRRKGIQIGKIPIMVGSVNCVLEDKEFGNRVKLKECPLDPGGYFICKGAEKVILIQEQLSKNRILVTDNGKKQDLNVHVTSSTHLRKSKTALTIKKSKYYVKHNSLSEDVNVCICFRAMGISNDMEIVKIISGNDPTIENEFLETIEEFSKMELPTISESQEFLGGKVRHFWNTNYSEKKSNIEEARDFLSNIFLSHVNLTGLSFDPKIFYLAYMVRVLIMAKVKNLKLDDKDYIGNKRLELAGELISLLFEDLFKRYNSDLKKTIDKILSKTNRAQEFDVLRQLALQGNIITEGLIRSISTGNWSLKRFKMDKAGVTQVLSRLSYISCIGMLTRVNSQFEKTRKVSGPRSLHPSQWGIFCPSDTPEGESCGLVKNLALLAQIATDNPTEPIMSALYSLGMVDILTIPLSYIFSNSLILIFLNGTPIGIISNMESTKKIINLFKRYRRSGLIKPMVSISLKDTEIHISSDGGRVCRPLIIVENGFPLLKNEILDEALLKNDFNVLIDNGVVEYLDINEENDSYIAISPKDINLKTTHMELTEYGILGAVAGLIPFPHHNQSPRNTYQCAMGKQAVGITALNQSLRMDSLLYSLRYPQKPLVSTEIIEHIGYDNLPAGQNSIVAIMSYSGFDIEDAIVINKASIDRGLGRCSVTKKFITPVKRYMNGEFDLVTSKDIEIPPYLEKRMNSVDPDGIAPAGSILNPGDVYINKYIPSGDGTYISKPSIWSTKLTKGIVDKVILSKNADDQLFIKTAIRADRRPEPGDKFSSRHGQKGVIGLIVNHEDMPFTEEGIVPDIIMNPHGLPSRMTVGKLLELISSKSASIRGKATYGDAFSENPINEIAEILSKNGYNSNGKDIMISGITGELLEGYIFIGPVYYQRLKHMVADKIHARARGQRAELTRQPLEGRSRDGGLRLGEMERDCLVGYGAAMLLVERLVLSSDAFTATICTKCSLISDYKCSSCGLSCYCTKIQLPYACKLLFQELQSMNIIPRIKIN